VGVPRDTGRPVPPERAQAKILVACYRRGCRLAQEFGSYRRAAQRGINVLTVISRHFYEPEPDGHRLASFQTFSASTKW
jgi:hypothetical protein